RIERSLLPATVVLIVLHLSTVASQARPELTNNVETDIGAHGNSKANRTISRGGGAARLPFARNEGGTGSTTHARKGKICVAIVVTREQRAHYRVLGAPQETSLTRFKVAIVLV